MRTVGVEEELLLVDADTLRPTPVAHQLLGPNATMPYAERVLELEVKREQIEVVNPPVHSLQELRSAIVRGRAAADAAALAVGARAVALATAPLECEPHLVSTPRYDRMAKQFGLTMDEQLTCGFHVHVAIESAEEGAAVLDGIRPWLPILLALSANSPFWQGTDTEFASYRYQAWGRWPTAGPYDRFGSADAYRTTVDQLLRAHVSLDAGMMYFDARLSTHAPTVEVRIADVCLRPDDAAALAVLTRALVTSAATEAAADVPADPVPTSLLRLASWRASRFGIGDELVHPVSRRLVPARDAVDALMVHADAGFADARERLEVHRAVALLFERGNGAVEQRAAHVAGADLADVIADALLRTHRTERPAVGPSEPDTAVYLP